MIRSFVERVRDDEAGFTLIEVMLAMFISLLVIGALAVSYVSAHNGVTSAQTETQLLAVADQQIEKIRQQVDAGGFDVLALKTNPGAPAVGGTNPTNPDDYLTGWSATYPNTPGSIWSPGAATTEAYLIESNYNNSTGKTIDGGTTYAEPLLVNGTWNSSLGQVLQTFSVTLASGEIVSGHVYITQASTSCLTGLVSGNCGADARRVIVAVQDASATHRKDVPIHPEYTSTIITRPEPANQQNLSNGLQVGASVS